MGVVKTFEDLLVWQKGHALVLEIYELTKSYPKDELYSLTQQMKRCVISVPNNIAEGFGRYTTKDYIHFLIQSRGSLYELE